MTAHLLPIILMALVATGAYWVQQEGMILERLGKFWSFLPVFWQKPFWSCGICMVSVWGIPTWFAVEHPSIWYLPIHLFAAAGLAAYLTK